jgi:hypothetical protein
MVASSARGWQEWSGMQQLLAVRVAELERQMVSLQDLSGRLLALESQIGSLEGQIVQLRSEMKTDFSAVRGELKEEARLLREDIKAGDTETRRYMRVLHEEVIDRIKTITRG